jgi:hypothetical protein
MSKLQTYELKVEGDKNHYYKCDYDNASLGIIQTTYKDNTFIDNEYKQILTNLENENDYMYSVYALGQWTPLKVSGRIYKKFTDENIIDYDYDPKNIINVCCDFNYDPMKWVLVQSEWTDDICFDEIVQYDTDTESMCNELIKKYPNGRFNIYGDYSGTFRSTRRRSTDYDIIRNTLNLKQDDIFVKPNPLVTVRTNIVNWRLKNNKGVRKLFATNKCEHLIKDFRRVVWEKNKKVEDQKTNPDLTHISSALGYYLNYKYTLKELIPTRISRTI